MAYLRIANLKKSYRVSRTEKQQVLRGINVEFKRGEFVAVLGESGCGKSTFMNILGGLDQDYTGSIVLDGEFLKDYSEKKQTITERAVWGSSFRIITSSAICRCAKISKWP